MTSGQRQCGNSWDATSEVWKLSYWCNLTDNPALYWRHCALQCKLNKADVLKHKDLNVMQDGWNETSNVLLSKHSKSEHSWSSQKHFPVVWIETTTTDAESRITIGIWSVLIGRQSSVDPIKTFSFSENSLTWRRLFEMTTLWFDKDSLTWRRF